MKKISYIILILCLTVAIRKAYAIETNLGPKVNIGLGWLYGKDWDSFLDAGNASESLGFNFCAGIYTDITFTRIGIFGASLQPELLYSRTRASAAFPNQEWEITFDIIQIPIYFKPKFRIGPGDFYFLVGPDMIFIVNTTQNFLSKTTHPKTDTFFTIGLGSGFGYSIPLGPGNLEYSIICTPYFTRLWKNSDTYLSKFAIEISYGFKI